MPMTFGEVMSGLKAAGTAQNRKIYARHGATEPMFGVSYAGHTKLAKKIKTDQALAEQLWATGNHDARILASKIADPAHCDHHLLEQWVSDLDSYVLADAFAMLAASSPIAARKRSKWSKSRKEWIGRSGWLMIAHAAKSPEAPDSEFHGIIERIAEEIGTAKNRTRDAMNSALIAIGSRHPFTKQAIDAARQIGKVEVDHGETGCKTPDAEPYIRKVLARKRTR